MPSCHHARKARSRHHVSLNCVVSLDSRGRRKAERKPKENLKLAVSHRTGRATSSNTLSLQSCLCLATSPLKQCEPSRHSKTLSRRRPFASGTWEILVHFLSATTPTPARDSTLFSSSYPSLSLSLSMVAAGSLALQAAAWVCETSSLCGQTLSIFFSFLYVNSLLA